MSTGYNGTYGLAVALRKESVDRNRLVEVRRSMGRVALRKESVDRNIKKAEWDTFENQSLSARRAWIEIFARANKAL